MFNLHLNTKMPGVGHTAVVSLHRRHPAVGSLKRPFPEPNPLAALLGGGDAAAASTDAPAARAAPGGGPQVAVGSRASGGVTQRKPTRRSE